MNSIVYNVITFVIFIVFHLAMRELLANWNSSSNDLVVLFDNIADSQSISNADVEFDTVNSVALLIDYVESIDVFSLEKFIAMLIIDEKESNNYNDVTRNSYFFQWLKTMREKLDSLLKNDIWNIVEFTLDKRKSLNDKWIYKFKRNVDDVVIRYKIRWCVKNFLQQYDIDFDQTFVFVVKSMTFRILFVVVVFLNLKIQQMNVKIAFLYELIDSNIYVKYSTRCDNDDIICKFNKALYELKQSFKFWYKRLFEFLLLKLNLNSFDANQSIFVIKVDFKSLIIITWIDDIKILAFNKIIATKAKTKLNVVFDMIDLESINFYFDMIIFKDRDMHIIRFNQKIYIQRVVKKFELQNAKSIRTFMKKSFDSIFNVNQTTNQNIKQYQVIMNSIMFAMIKIKSNIANAIFIINRFA